MSTATIDAAQETPEVQQPTDIIEGEVENDPTPEQAEESKRVEVAIRRVTTDLTLDKDADPNDMSPAQVAALKGILNFEINEHGAWPQVLAFMHMCVKRGLDPFNREAYLIARGKIGTNGRKWTMQTGIDGYLMLAARTGLYVGVRDRVWTGNDDGKDSWWFDERTGIRRRVWSDFWPASAGEPGAARVTIDHLTARGVPVATDYVADWSMYAPYFDEWKEGKRTGKKTVSDMWVKGGPMMLSKCGIAAGLRLAIPGGLNGLYIHEEMHRADADEKALQQSAARARVVEAQAKKVGRPMPTLTAKEVKPEPTPEVKDDPAGMAPGEAPTGPLLPMPQEPDDVVDAEVEDDEPTVEEPTQDDATIRRYLIEEGEWMASLYPDKIADADALFARQVDAAGVKSFTDLPLDDLAGAVMSKRKAVSGRLNETDAAGATRYAAIERGDMGEAYVGSVADLLGG